MRELPASLCLRFFFSSRRRHTRSLCDWSSDVCSSDLIASLVRNQPVSEDVGMTGEITLTGQVLPIGGRSEEHTSELQSHSDLVCRLLLEKKKKKQKQKSTKQNKKKQPRPRDHSCAWRI